jgi:hypothetical protein
MGEDRTELDAFELNRITDRVVQLIDDRVIARRERLGRV